MLFLVKGSLGEEASPDISGLIGMYAHDNEPGYHIPYLFNYMGQPWKTVGKVRFITNHFCTAKPDDVIGNEDAVGLGTFSLRGASTRSARPTARATIQLAAGNILTIAGQNNSAANNYIQAVPLNGKSYPKSYHHAPATAGGRQTHVRHGPYAQHHLGRGPRRPAKIRAPGWPLTLLLLPAQPAAPMHR